MMKYLYRLLNFSRVHALYAAYEDEPSRWSHLSHYQFIAKIPEITERCGMRQKLLKARGKPVW